MHDIRQIRENPESFDAGLARRGVEPVAQTILAIDEQRRAVATRMQEGQSRRNEASKAIGKAMGQGDTETAEALKAAEVFRGGGQFAKFPMRIVKAFGLLNLIRFRYGLATLSGAFRGFSRRFSFTIHPVLVTDGALAIDVDNERTLHIAETILGERGSALSEPPQEMRLDRTAHSLGDALLA